MPIGVFKRRIAALFIALALMVGASGGVVATTEEPASAHIWDGWSHWFCAQARPSGTTIVHGVPDYLDRNYTRFYCRAQTAGGRQWQYWVQAWHAYENNIWARPWAYQYCVPYGYIICEEP